MKKIILFAIGLLTSMNIHAELKEYEDANGLKYRYDDEDVDCKATLIDGKSVNKTKIDFILTFFEVDSKTYTVTSIGEEAFTTKDNNNFTGNQSIDYVIIPEGVSTIEANAFNNCSKIRLLELPSTITSIESTAFKGCSQLTYVYCKRDDANTAIPSSLPNNELMTLFVPVGCADESEKGYLNTNYYWKEKFGDRIFEGEMKIVLSSSEEMTYVCATGENASKKAIIIEGKRKDNVIVNSSIAGDDGITYQVEGVGRDAFYGFSELCTLKINEGISYISNSAFQNCSNLRQFELPISLKTIGSSAFQNCRGLKSITLPSGLTSIGNNVFRDCSNMAEIVSNISGSNIFAFPNDAFPDKTIILYIPSGAKEQYATKDWNTTNFLHIFEGERKEEFNSEKKLTYVYTETDTEAVLLKSDPQNTIVEIDQKILDRNVTAIAKAAFVNNTELKSTTIPEEVRSIGKYAFSNCNKLAEIVSNISGSNIFAFPNDAFPDKYIILYIPSGAKEQYATKDWNTTNFLHIFEGERKEEFNSEKKLTYVYTETDTEAVLLKSDPENTTAVIGNPSLGKTVTAIAKSAFINNVELVEIAIPDGVNAIGSYAFRGCSKLKKVVLPSSLTSIGDYAFNGCSLDNVVIKVTNPIDINSNVFSSYAASLYVPKNSRDYYTATDVWKKFTFIYEGEMGEKNFTETGLSYAYATGDKTAVLISSVPTTTKVIIPSKISVDAVDDYTVIGIEKSALASNSTVEEIEIQDNIKNIGANAFKGCSKLKKVELPSSLTSIGDNVFNGCSELTDVIYSGTPASISFGAGLFQNCTSLKMVTLPAGLSSIGNNVFKGCSNLTEIVSEIDDNSIFSFPKTAFPDNNIILYITSGTKEQYESQGWIASNFLHVFKGARVEYTDSEKKLTYVYTESDSEAVLLKSDPENTTAVIENANIGKTVTAIAKSAFINNAELMEISIPDGVKTIGTNAFKGCSKLKKVELPSSLASIGENAFNGSTLDYVIVKVQSPIDISSNVFSSYKGSLYVPSGSRPSYQGHDVWKKFAFTYEGEMKEKTFDDTGLSYVCATAEKTAVLVSSTPSSKKVTIPSKISVDGEDDYTVIGIKESAMVSNSSVEELEIQENVRTIGANAFKGCSKLKKVELPSSLTSIGDNAFNGSTLDYVIIKVQSPIDISSNVFSSYKGSLYVPSGSRPSYQGHDVWKKFAFTYEGEMREKTFDDTGLSYACATAEKTAVLVSSTPSSKKVTIPSKISVDGEDDYTVIGIKESAMASNSSVEELEIQENVRTIGANAFKGCSKLKKVELPSSLTSIGDNAFNGSTLDYVIVKVQSPIDISSNVFSSYKGSLYVPSGSRPSYQGHDVWKKFAFTYEGEMKEKTFDDTGLSYVCATSEKTAVLVSSTPSSKKVTIPSKISVDGEDDYTVIGIKESAMASNSAVEELEIQENVRTIGANAFKGCSKLKKVELPSSLATIGENAFNGSTLDYVIIKVQNPLNINDNVFSSYKGSLYVPEGSRAKYQADDVWKKFAYIYEGEMKKKTFDDTGLSYVCATAEKTAILVSSMPSSKKVTIPSTITIEDIEYKVISIDKSAVASNTSVEELEIQENIKIIGDDAFKGCSKLKKVMLPASLDFIGNNAFEKCSSLALVICAGDKPAIIKENSFPSIEIIILVPSGKVDVYQDEANWWRKYILVDTMSSISYDYDPEEAKPGIYVVTASVENSSNPTVALVNDLKISGEFIIPQIVTIDGVDYIVTSIASGTFENNTGLTNILIPSTIETIGESAFAGCTNLKAITVNRTEPIDFPSPAGTRGFVTRSSGRAVFDGVNKATCILYVPDVSLDKYKNAAVWRDFENIIPFKTTGIKGIVVDGQRFDVYDMQGRKVKSNVSSLNNLSAGIYIVNGKKMVIK